MKTDEAIKIIQSYVDDARRSHGYNNLQMATAALLLDTLNLRKPEPPPLSPELRRAVMAIEARLDELAEGRHDRSAYVIGMRDAVRIIEKMREE